MSIRIIPAILSGGAGTRLWPLSTPERPKQFHTMGHSQTLFQATVTRLNDKIPEFSASQPMVLCGQMHVPLARAALQNQSVTLVVESAPRNTAAIAAAAAAIAREADPSALVLLQPADHRVSDLESFRAAIAAGARVARDRIVTFGIKPTRPATCYGYIKRARVDASLSDIAAFKEKPDEQTARAYIESGDYLWNAGIFLFHPEVLLEEFKASPQIRDAALEAFARAERRDDEIWLDETAFAAAPSLPLDIAVMEKTARGAVVACDFGWADVGTWDEVWRLAPRDGNGFALLGAVAAADLSKIEASGVKALAVDGPDLVAVAAPHGILIAPRALADDKRARLELAARLKP